MSWHETRAASLLGQCPSEDPTLVLSPINLCFHEAGRGWKRSKHLTSTGATQTLLLEANALSVPRKAQVRARSRARRKVNEPILDEIIQPRFICLKASKTWQECSNMTFDSGKKTGVVFIKGGVFF